MAIDFKKYIMSTGTHYIANSGSDENKAYHGGAGGGGIHPAGLCQSVKRRC